VDEILAHPWFKTVDAQEILSKTIDPPFKPALEDGKYDLSCFDPAVTCLDPNESF
jgi:hypothetical protein